MGQATFFEEIMMKAYGHKLSFFLGVLALVGLFGCKQESPAGKATEAAVDAMKTPMDKASQAEGKLEKSAEQTAAEIKKSTK